MRRRVGRTAIALVLFSVALAALAPATLIDAALAARTRGDWRIAESHGVWWRGAGILVARNVRTGLPFAWRVALPALLRGTFSVTLLTPDGHLIASVEASSDRFRVERLGLRIPAAFAAAFAASFAPAAAIIAAGGTLAIDSPSFEWSDARAAGSVDARWVDARLAFAGVALDLGDVTLALTPQAGGQALQGPLTNRGGDLSIAGTVEGSARGVALRLALTPHITTPAPVRAALALLGPPDASGSVHVAWASTR